MATFQERLEMALQMRGLKPADLARLTGIGEGAISQYRKGAYKATQRNLEKISRVLNVPIPWLMGADVSVPDNSNNTQPTNTIRIAGRDGSYTEKRLTDDQVKALRIILDQMPDAEDL